MLKPALLTLVLLTPGAAFAQAPHPAEIIAATERAFAADGLAMGVKRSFLKWSAPEAIMLQATPVNVHKRFAALPDPKPGEEPPLVWWPTWTGIARSEDLAISTGPVEEDGRRASHYFTVWKRQPDGSWKWIYDGGVAVDAAYEPGKSAPAAYLPVAAVGSASPAAAMAEVRAAEAALASALDLKAAHLAALADDGRLYAPPRAPAKSRAEFARALDAWPANLTLSSPTGGEASAGGDLVFTYGPAGWSGAQGWYVHIWQKRAPQGQEAVWKLVFAQLSPAAPPPAAS